MREEDIQVQRKPVFDPYKDSLENVIEIAIMMIEYLAGTISYDC